MSVSHISSCVLAFLSLLRILSCLAVIESDWYFAALSISAMVRMKKWSQAVFIRQSNGENLSAWSFLSWWKMNEAGRVLRDATPWPETVTSLILVRFFILPECSWAKAGYPFWLIITFPNFMQVAMTVWPEHAVEFCLHGCNMALH